MQILIVGAHGSVGRLLVERLATRRHEVRAMVRSPDQQPGLAALGATETVVADLERDCGQAVRGVDGVVFLAGASPCKGPERVDAINRVAAIRLIEQAERAGVERYITLSPLPCDPAQVVASSYDKEYLAAKHAADERLRRSSLAWTIVRTCRLTDHPKRGRIALGEGLGEGRADDEIARADVAALLAAILDAPTTHRRTLDLLAGEMSIRTAIAAVPTV